MKINPKNFKLGDFIFLQVGRDTKKSEDHYTGPHKILEVINRNKIRIQMNSGSKVVNANRLRLSHINKQAPFKKKKLGRTNINELSD